MSASEAPVLLGRICSLWRTISLSTPRLWAKLHIVEPVPRYGLGPLVLQEKLAQRLETTKMWLGRSGQCPLSISLQTAPEDQTTFDTTTSPETSRQFLEALIPFAPRWQHIHFTTLPPALMETISHLEIDAPSLETVAFHHHNYRSLPRAQISSFSIPGGIFDSEKLPLRWDQLTTLLISGNSQSVGLEMTSAATLRAISRCPRLRHCQLMVNDSWATEPSQHLVVELQFLHTLHLHCVGNAVTAVSVLLEHLSLPDLRNFTFVGHMHAPGQNAPHFSFADFFARSTRMESVDLDSNAFSKSSFLQNLRAAWLHDRMNGWGIPSVFDDEALAYLDAALLRFITAKMTSESGTTLTRVDVQFDRYMLLDIFPSLQPFIETGLDVSITHLPLPTSRFSPWQGLSDAPDTWDSSDNYW
ncbi:hypothetical protein B0H13DRAFT_2011020 [Mycena leptocephala]|nr:hypothetical protein B0H13DRAFT_2011020 [Mycena leptocephala]